MKRVLFSAFALAIILAIVTGCNPLLIMVPKTEEILLDPVTSGDYVDKSGTDYIQILNKEIKPDRELEIYYYPDGILGYWAKLIDVDIFLAPGGGELLIYDDDPTNPHIYKGKTIRVIVTWYVEEQYQPNK
jgi:hypothetical protein